MMNKILLVTKREYITRVRNKTFIISTFLTPLLFAGLITAVGYFTAGNATGNAAAESLLKSDKADPSIYSSVAYITGYLTSFVIYITIIVYGTMVMRGVSEEKTNRVAEIIISSVKPFQLMMGKIIGIGAVGLTQFFLWGILLIVFSAGIFFFIPPESVPQMSNGAANATESQLLAGLASVNLPLIIFCFIFYFLFGYLFYASLFAAVGSAVSEDAHDTQSLILPVTMPIILAIVIMMNAITDPSGNVAMWSSQVPFFSPVVMMARIPFGVPETVAWWELILSMMLLFAGFIFTTWLSAKIYRTGILLYGKKVTWKEMWKWTRRS